VGKQLFYNKGTNILGNLKNKKIRNARELL
jgi:hypothetical protein